MKRYWHKKPLLIRQAIPGMQAFLSRGALFDLAARDDDTAHKPDPDEIARLSRGGARRAGAARALSDRPMKMPRRTRRRCSARSMTIMASTASMRPLWYKKTMNSSIWASVRGAAPRERICPDDSKYGLAQIG
jgi:hypothetical protein